MKRKWMTSPECTTRPGLTLIELVAGMALLGVLLVGLLQARASHARQAGRASERLRLVDAADQWLARHWTAISPPGSEAGAKASFPRSSAASPFAEVSQPQSTAAATLGGQGVVQMEDGLWMNWRATPLENPELRQMNLHIVRYEFTSVSSAEPRSIASGDDRAAHVAIDLLLPIPSRAANESVDGGDK